MFGQGGGQRGQAGMIDGAGGAVARNRIRDRFARDAGDRRLASGVHVRDPNGVRGGEGVSEGLEAIAGAAVQMGLKDGLASRAAASVAAISVG